MKKKNETVKALYPEGIHGAVASGIAADIEIRYAALDEPDQ